MTEDATPFEDVIDAIRILHLLTDVIRALPSDTHRAFFGAVLASLYDAAIKMSGKSQTELNLLTGYNPDKHEIH